MTEFTTAAMSIGCAVISIMTECVIRDPSPSTHGRNERHFVHVFHLMVPSDILPVDRDADVILVLEKGRLAEHGTHEELMKRQGLYYYLCSQQLGL